MISKGKADESLRKGKGVLQGTAGLVLEGIAHKDVSMRSRADEVNAISKSPEVGKGKANNKGIGKAFGQAYSPVAKKGSGRWKGIAEPAGLSKGELEKDSELPDLREMNQDSVISISSPDRTRIDAREVFDELFVNTVVKIADAEHSNALLHTAEEAFQNKSSIESTSTSDGGTDIDVLTHQEEPEESDIEVGTEQQFQEKYAVGKVLGEGEFGIVRECTDRKSGEVFAVKEVPHLAMIAVATAIEELDKILQAESDMRECGYTEETLLALQQMQKDLKLKDVEFLPEKKSSIFLDREVDAQAKNIMKTVFDKSYEVNAEGFSLRVLKLNAEEFRLVRHLDHPHIVKTFALYQSQKMSRFVMEKMGGGELFSFVEKRGGLDVVEALTATAAILDALTYMHEEHRVVHADVKAENIFLLSPDNLNDVKLGDFGMVQQAEKIASEGNKKVCESYKPGVFQLNGGTLGYTAPEVLFKSLVVSEEYNYRPQGSGYNAKCDVWSVGILLYAMLRGELPFNFNRATNEEIAKVSKRLLDKRETQNYTQGREFSRDWRLNYFFKNMLTRERQRFTAREGRDAIREKLKTWKDVEAPQFGMRPCTAPVF